MTSKDRINQALKESEVTQISLAAKLKLTKGSVSGLLSSPGEAPEHYINAVAELTGFLPQWLKTGTGLKKKESGGNESTTSRGNEVPVFDTVAVGGLSLVQEDQPPMSRSYETVNTGTLFREASAAMRVYGDSMYPKYQAGCMIALREVFDKDNIVYGEDYVIETSEQRVLKRLLRSDKGEEYIEMNSINPQKDDRGRPIYAPKDIHLTKIRRIYKVLGQVRYEIGGDTIIHRAS